MNTRMRFKVIDNTGAREAICIDHLGGGTVKRPKLGSPVKVVVKKADPSSQKINVKNNAKCIFDGKVVALRARSISPQGVIQHQRCNAVILTRKDGKKKNIPVGTSINGFINHASTISGNAKDNKEAMNKMFSTATGAY